MNFQNVLLSERSQTQENTYERLHGRLHCISPLIGSAEKRQIYRQKVDQWLPGLGRRVHCK